MRKNKYIIVAGINGAGKSTLYRLQPELFSDTQRINADEILKNMGGDWRNPTDNLKAMREEIKILHTSLSNKISIHVETTLAGTGKSQLNLIDEAHKNNFEVTLLYVALDSISIAINRVTERVSKGGHGIPKELIKKRYVQSFRNLPKIALKSDNVFIYDNSEKFQIIYTRKNNEILINNLAHYPWITSDLFDIKK